MLKARFCFFSAWAYLILTLPVLFRVKYLNWHGRAKERDKLADEFTMKAARYILRLTGAKVHMKGLENIPMDSPVLFVSNHQSHIDNLIIHGLINVPKGFVSIVEMLKVPLLRTWMKYMKCVFIDRMDVRQTLHCMEEAVINIKEGRSMVIFPEGKVNSDGVLGEFKRGSLKIAIKTGVPVVPIALKNSHKLMNRDGSRIQAAEVECIISKPISTIISGKAEEAQLIERVRDTICDQLA